MSPAPDPYPLPASAPDLTGPVSFVDWATSGPSRARRRRPAVFDHVHVEIDLRHERLDEPRIPILRQFEQLLREREVVEPTDLLRLAAGALHAFQSRGFAHVDHWEVEPGGWLPLPEPTHRTIDEPLSHLLRALSSEAWATYAKAREFRVRISGHPKIRADLAIRRVHRERGHSISIDLTGRIGPRDVAALAQAMRERVPVLRASVTAYRVATAPARR